MGVREKLIALEELAARKCTVTFSTDGSLKNGAELCVDNCRCIKELDDNFIVMSVSGMDIRVSGTPLTLQNFGVGSVKITGQIHSLTFEENDNG
ncbi:MAG: YabP/YqfC family sporulation protein [Oscillospiraceae bacterium]|nr:YabP/YqfC family sporulation protein [Oscillospiraceae bacterium]